MLNTSLHPHFRLGQFFGTPVYADRSAWVLLAIVLLLNGTGGAAAIVASVFVAAIAIVSLITHELGHALAVRWRGYGRSEIILGGLGGVCRWRGNPTRGDTIRIALAGPAASLLLAGVAFAIWAPLRGSLDGAPIVSRVLFAAVALNVAWGVFNLLPIFPMDGGRALRAALLFKLPVREAARRSVLVSAAVGGVLALVAIAAGEIFIVVVLAMLLFQNWTEWKSLQ